MSAITRPGTFLIGSVKNTKGLAYPQNSDKCAFANDVNSILIFILQ